MSSTASISEVLENLVTLFMSNRLSTFVLPLILLSIVLYKSWQLISNPAATRKILPPSPPKLPIIGNLHQLAATPLPHRSLFSLSQKYGNIMLLHLGSRPTLVISSADLAREIMKTHDVIFANRPYLCILRSIIYDGKDVALAPYGDNWRHRKSICVLQLLSNKRVRSFRQIREEETNLMIKKIQETGSSLPVNLTELIMTVINDVVCKATLGRKINSEYDGVNMMDIMKELTSLVDVFDVRDFIPWLGWIVSRVSGLVGKVDKVARAFDQFLERVLQEHSSRLGDQEEDGEKVDDFVDVMLKIQMENKAAYSIDRDEIKAILLDMFTAGTDTSQGVLDWAMAELLRHPHVMKKLQVEIRSTRPERETTEIIYEHELENTKYLKAVIKETLRLHPPLPLLLPRESTQDVKINGFDIVAGTQVMINAWAIQRDPTVWDEEPDKFYPERFLNSDQTLAESIGQGFGLISFGAGRRGCPGISFATAINELVLANLVAKFEWTLPDGARGEDMDMSEGFNITTHRKNPLLVVATPYY